MKFPSKEVDKRVNVPPDIVSRAYEGDAIAQLMLGKAYFDATLVEDNHDMAFKWILRSAEQGNMEARFRLGDLYALGQGTIKSLPDAYKWYTVASIQGYKKALTRIHNLYQEDTRMHCHGQINSEEEEWASKKFKQDNKIRELNEYRIEQNKSILNGAIDYYTEQFKYYKSSSQDDPVVQLNLAFLYQHGYGAKKCTRWAFEYFRLAAEQGNIDAQYSLGVLYQKHARMKFNYRDAFNWFTKSAQGGHIAAQKSLAYFYLKGLVTDVNYDTAAFWYTKAAEAGDSEAQVVLGKLYRQGKCIKKDLSMAVKWYSLAARQGNIVAQNCLSQLHQHGLLGGIELEEDTSEYLTEDSMKSRLRTTLSVDISKLGDLPNLEQLNELARRALIGDGQAMYEIGLKYLKSDDDFAQDQEVGVKWIKNAANAKHKNAQLMMADLYKKGDSIEQDYHKAATWYKRLAKTKDPDAQFHVGVMYNEGLGVRNDPLEASKWFTWTADQGNSDSQYNLGMLRLQGKGISKDDEEALKWIFKSAHQENIYACYEIGFFYFNGQYQLNKDKKRGLKLMEFAAQNKYIKTRLAMDYWYKQMDVIDKDMRKVIDYFSMAAESGSVEAQYQLGIIYLEDYYTDRNYIRAFNLFKLAKDQGYKHAESIFRIPFQYSLDIENYYAVIEMFIEVTEKGNDNLHYHIGSIYEHGLQEKERKYVNKNYTEARKWYLAASKKGDARADYRLGILHEDGKGVKKNVDRAIKYFKMASMKGSSDASYKLACIYLKGYGVTQNLLKAFKLYKKASIMGHQEAIESLILSKGHNEIEIYSENLSSDELHIGTNEKIKVSMLEKATEEELTRLQYQLGVMYENDNDYPNAIKWFNLAADIEVTDAYYRLGIFYEEGSGIGQDYEMAAEMYHKAAEKDHEDACFRLARLYQYGTGVELDYSKAYQFYKKAANMDHKEARKVLNITLDTKINSSGNTEEAFFDPSSQEFNNSLLMCKHVAEHGDTDMQFKVGFAYEHSFLEPNYDEASSWYSLATKNSHKDALYHLGLLYENGLGVPQDYQKANQLYQQASLLNSDGALYQLGVAHHHGKGVDFDPVKAMKYYTISAELGNPKYQCELGRLYEQGELGDKNLLEALKWYSKAYLQGYDAIKPKLDTMDIDKPYETVFFQRLVRILSIASRGQFRLNQHYNTHDYYAINNRLGISYFFGNGTNKNLEKAWKYFAKKYSDSPGFMVYELLSLGYGLSSSEKHGILKSLIENNALMDWIDEDHLYEVGMIFFDGIKQTQDGYTSIDYHTTSNTTECVVIEKDYLRAFKFLNKAAGMNHAKALFRLGIMFHCGYGVNQDSRQGDIYFDAAARKDIRLTACIAPLYHTHRNIQNFTLAFEWYKRAERGVYEILDNRIGKVLMDIAESGVGLLYEYGDGVEQDHHKALELYRDLSHSLSSIGTHRLALMYYYGKGVSVDYKRSFDLFKEAIDGKVRGTEMAFVYDQSNSNGTYSQNNLVYRTVNRSELHGESHYYLGLHYKTGQGVPQDAEKSQKHFREAFNCGCKRAKCEIEY